MWEPTSGTDVVDTLIDGVDVGDNLVFQGDEGAPLDVLVDRFVAGSRGHVPLVLVRLAADPGSPVPPGVTLLDWTPARTRAPAVTPEAVTPEAVTPQTVTPGASFEEALTSLHDLETRVGSGAAYVFDRLSAVQDVWGSDAALELFLSTCPRLYRRRSVALWPVEAPRHRPTFLRRLEEITQVVVALGWVGDELALTVRKADGRRPSVVGRKVHVEVHDGDLRPTGTPTTTRERLGTVVRERRLALGLPQAETARRVGISPSALSQAERGVRGLSGDTLMRLWEVLGVPFGPPAEPDRGYVVARRSGRERIRLQAGLTAEQVVADASVGEVWRVEVAPGASGDRAPFAVKAPESIVVVRGVLDVHVDGRTETLHEGDALVATDAAIGPWANPGGTATEIVWSLHPRR